MSLDGRTALVTGASRGLGAAIARALAERGAKVACMARRGPELDTAVLAITSAGREAIATPADVTRADEVAAALDGLRSRWGGPDILVLNAGTWLGAPLAETSEELWDRMMTLNAKGAFLVLRHALPGMIAARRGTIVGIDSIGGLVGSAGSAAYAASKWALRGLLESAALELKAHRIRVSIVYPHNINSAGREIAGGSPERDQNLEPADIAALVAHIAAAPDHVSIGNVSIWPLAAGIGLR